MVTNTSLDLGGGIIQISPPPNKYFFYDKGTEVTLFALSKDPFKHQFVGWSGECSGKVSNCTVTMNENKRVDADFSVLYAPPPTPFIAKSLIDQVYLAQDGLEIVMNSLTVSKNGPVTSVSISYSLTNSSTVIREERGLKLYYSGGGGLPQYGFFGQVLPGQTISRTHTFQTEFPTVPILIAYPSRFFASTWEQEDIIWYIYY